MKLKAKSVENLQRKRNVLIITCVSGKTVYGKKSMENLEFQQSNNIVMRYAEYYLLVIMVKSTLESNLFNNTQTAYMKDDGLE